MTKQMEERNAAEQRSASLDEVRSFNLAVQGSDKIFYESSNLFFCVSGTS